MKKIITLTEGRKLTQELKRQQKRIVLAGGCFDLLHKGHLAFLNQAKQRGDHLIILLESDAMIRKRKGPDRPKETQDRRAHNLAAEIAVDSILLLPSFMENSDYDNLVSELKPAIIATTKGDPLRFHKERQAKMIGAEVVDVIDRLSTYSTTGQIQKAYENE